MREKPPHHGRLGWQDRNRRFFELILADTGDGQKLFRLLIQYLQGHISKRIIDALCHFRTDAFDLPGREIGNDAFSGWDNLFLVPLDIILNAVFGILRQCPRIS